jgi:hypothetical protein
MGAKSGDRATVRTPSVMVLIEVLSAGAPALEPPQAARDSIIVRAISIAIIFFIFKISFFEFPVVSGVK